MSLYRKITFFLELNFYLFIAILNVVHQGIIYMGRIIRYSKSNVIVFFLGVYYFVCIFVHSETFLWVSFLGKPILRQRFMSKKFIRSMSKCSWDQYFQEGKKQELQREKLGHDVVLRKPLLILWEALKPKYSRYRVEAGEWAGVE